MIDAVNCECAIKFYAAKSGSHRDAGRNYRTPERGKGCNFEYDRLRSRIETIPPPANRGFRLPQVGTGSDAGILL